MDLASVNNNVLMEILLRLPAKSIIRFKSVCKKWLYLISSDYFCHQHTLRHPKLEPSLIIEMHSFEFFYLKQTIDGKKVMIPSSPSLPDHKILQDCNGLLLLESEHNYYDYNPTTDDLKLNPESAFYVYNPTTRQSRKITPMQSDKFPYVESMSLAFDPSKSPFYKVVCVRNSSYPTSDSHAYRIEVYDSESHTWKVCLEPSTCPRISKRGVHWNNSIFWITWEDRHRPRTCCFDIAKNEIKNLSFPRYDGTPRNGLFTDLQELNGHMYCFELINDFYGAFIIVWELGGDDNSEWLEKHIADFRGDEDEEQRGWLSPIRLVAGDGATCSFLLHDCHDSYDSDNTQTERMMAYNFLDGSYELLVRLQGHRINMGYNFLVMKGFQFGETLALV